MKIVVGLGNPGPKYKGTRHNIGFEIADEVARRASTPFESAPADALMARWRRAAIDAAGIASDVLLVKPMTFMNHSGQAVGELVRYFKIDLSDVLIVLDEVQLPLGRLRARARGSAGGHNGLKSVIAHLGEEVARLRVGVGRGPSDDNGQARRDLADHVLARFESDELPVARRMTMRGADAVETFITSGIVAVMNTYNGGDPETTE